MMVDEIQRRYDGGCDPSVESDDSKSAQVRLWMYGSRTLPALAALGAVNSPTVRVLHCPPLHLEPLTRHE
jgi:hypothetical protein